MIRITEAMFKSGKPISQGEVNIWMKKYAPPEVISGMSSLKLSEMKLESGELILGHSESGHHHVLEPADKSVPISKAAIALIDEAKDTFVELSLMQDCELLHKRGHDTHQSYMLPAGEYIRGIREEQTVDGWRRVAD